MTLTLLFDLDDTLLSNDIGTFLPVYLQGLGRHLAPYAPPEKLIPALLAATQRMVQNNRPDRSLREVFENDFYPSLGLQAEDLHEAIESFYADFFPTLLDLTQIRPDAIKLVQAAFDRGYSLVVATSPLFPRSAILQRLDWAGLSALDYPYKLITSYETSHFAKPNLAYYAEVLAQLGWPEEPVVMIGDSLYDDIHPARCLGLPAFWINDGSSRPADGLYAPSGHGALPDLLPWLDSTHLEALQPDLSHPNAMLAILRATPAALASLLQGLSASTWDENPQSGEWSLTEILCHLRDVDSEVNLPRLIQVILEHNPFLPGMDTDPWAEERLYFCQNGLEALESFTNHRMQILDLLENLKERDWKRPARHAIFGPTDLKELVSIIAGHDRIHLQQAHAALSALTQVCVPES